MGVILTIGYHQLPLQRNGAKDKLDICVKSKMGLGFKLKGNNLSGVTTLRPAIEMNWHGLDFAINQTMITFKLH
jgi:hypothetical protein